MKLTILKYFIILTAFMIVNSQDLFAQKLTEIEGSTEIKMNSEVNKPHLELKENTDNDFARLYFTNTNNPDSRWSLASNTGTTADKGIGFFYNGFSRFYYNEDLGGIGIGTITPEKLLHLNFSGTNGILVEGNGTGDAIGLHIKNAAGNHFIFDDDDDNHNLVIQSSRDLALVAGNTNEGMTIREIDGGINVNGWSAADTRLGIFTESDEYGMRIDHDGIGIAVGLEATTESNFASTKYGVSGRIDGSSGSGVSMGLRGFASSTPTSFWAVYAVGDFWYTGDLIAPSDRRLKKNIQDMESVLSKVLQLETKTYEFDREKYAGLNLANGPKYGFIAQDVQTLFPTLVEEERHTYELAMDDETGESKESEISILGMSSIEMIPILTKAIQEQQAIIEQLKLDVEELKSQK